MDELTLLKDFETFGVKAGDKFLIRCRIELTPEQFQTAFKALDKASKDLGVLFILVDAGYEVSKITPLSPNG